MGSYRVTVRHGPKVERERYAELEGALDALERWAARLAREADARPVDLKLVRRFDPVRQVVARIEVSGPGRLRAGVDVRGDGSVESFTGRLRRRLVPQRPRESAVDALRREVAHG
ncbi:MAG: hypothetical protein IRZ21_02525 [Thermoleophilaceae bacterium]|nr:hypothetical protein [Thermoleophilaceae bacterium]